MKTFRDFSLKNHTGSAMLFIVLAAPGCCLLHEKASKPKLCGIALILTGLLIIALTSK